MQLIPPLESHFVEMIRWFPNEPSLTEWSGPNFRFPLNICSFVEDLNLDRLRTFAMVNGDNELVAFGQFYRRLNKCHLGRLIVAPNMRGKGVASVLLTELCLLGIKELKVKECSLFVLSHNDKAIKAYQKFGFLFVEYPEQIPLDNCLYMVKA